MTNKHLIVTSVNHGFIVKFMHGESQKEAAIYLSLGSAQFEEDTKKFFKDPTDAELKKMEKKAKAPIK